MPKIPQYSAQRSLRTEPITTQAPSVEISPQALTQSIRATGELGQAMASVGERIYQLNAQEELSKANIKSHEGRLAIENTEDGETTGWLERRNKEIKDLRNSIVKGMRNPLARSALEADFDNEILDTQYRLKKTHATLSVNNANATLFNEQETATKEILSGLTPEREQARIDKIGARYSQIAKMGGMTPKKALEEFRKWKGKLPEYKAERDILNNPSFALAELQKGKEGVYKDLPFDKRTDLIESAESRIEKLQNQQKEAIAIAQNQREADLVDMKIAGTLTESQVKEARETGTISAKFADSMINAIRSPKVYKPDALDSIIKFNELVERNAKIMRRENTLFVKAHFDELAKLRADVVNANAKGYISDKQMTDLLSPSSKAFYRDPVFQNALNQLASQSSLYATEEYQSRAKSEMYGNLIKKVIAGKNSQEAVTEVIKEKLTEELAQSVVKDEFGFQIGDVKNGYEYIGDNQWRKKTS